jgi:Uma2 family endonuclease
MTVDTSHLGATPSQGEWTIEDLTALPGEGMCHEIVDGLLLVTATPYAGHQIAVSGLVYALRMPCPADLYVLPAPLDYRPDDRNSVQPDIMVVRSSDIDLDGPVVRRPLLVVEVLSGGTRRNDLGLKRGLYQDCGIPAYWVFDPAAPSLTMFDLIDGEYQRAALLVGEQEMVVEWPYPVRLCPAELASG